jgi:hypothetical protein
MGVYSLVARGGTADAHIPCDDDDGDDDDDDDECGENRVWSSRLRSSLL